MSMSKKQITNCNPKDLDVSLTEDKTKDKTKNKPAVTTAALNSQRKKLKFCLWVSDFS